MDMQREERHKARLHNGEGFGGFLPSRKSGQNAAMLLVETMARESSEQEQQKDAELAPWLHLRALPWREMHNRKHQSL